MKLRKNNALEMVHLPVAYGPTDFYYKLKEDIGKTAMILNQHMTHFMCDMVSYTLNLPYVDLMTVDSIRSKMLHSLEITDVDQKLGLHLGTGWGGFYIPKHHYKVLSKHLRDLSGIHGSPWMFHKRRKVDEFIYESFYFYLKRQQTDTFKRLEVTLSPEEIARKDLEEQNHTLLPNGEQQVIENQPEYVSILDL